MQIIAVAGLVRNSEGEVLLVRHPRKVAAVDRPAMWIVWGLEGGVKWAAGPKRRGRSGRAGTTGASRRRERGLGRQEGAVAGR